MSTTNSGWDYNCPQYVDFMTSNTVEENDDEWFEHDHEDEEVFEDISNKVKESIKRPNEKIISGNQNLSVKDELKVPNPSNFNCLSDVTNSSERILFSDSHKKLKVLLTSENIFSSNPAHKAVRIKQDGSQGKCVRRSPRFNVKNSPIDTTKTSLNVPVSSDVKRFPKRTSSSSDKTNNTSTSSNGESSKPLHKFSKMPKLAIPNTPPFMKRMAVKSKNLKSSEELELQRITDLRNELSRHRKLAQDSLKEAIIGKTALPQLSKKEPTCPEEFNFKTALRIKENNVQQNVEEKNFAAQLRSNKLSSLKKNLGPTIVKPFNLSESRKRKLNETPEKKQFTSLASLVEAYQNETPERFRSRPAIDQDEHGLPVAKEKVRVTIAKTPNLLTRHRKRSISVPSALKLEEEEIEEMKKYQFRARPLNTKILQKPDMCPKVELKPITHSKKIELETEKRSHIWHSKVKEDEAKFQFKAQPVPVEILKRPVGIAPFIEIPPTVPESPAFSTRTRTKLLNELEKTLQAEEIKPIIKANPVPHFGVPFKPKPLQKPTIPEPFSFDEKDQERFTKKGEKIKEIIKEETKIPDFHAQPIPNLTLNLPPKQKRERTKTEPFQLEVDVRGQAYQEQLKKKLEDELKEMKAKAVFKANPSKVVYKEPFVPAKEHKSFTDFQPVELATEVRHSQRKAFDEFIKCKQKQIEILNQEKESEKLSDEKEAIARLRAETVHKPEPLRHYKAVHFTSSNIPLTLPLSPNFTKRNRQTNI